VRNAAPVLDIVSIRISIAGESPHGRTGVVPLATVVVGHGSIIADHPHAL
jgi:hypothetical protein